MKKAPPMTEPVDAVDQYNLAIRYYNGEGVLQDYTVAARWYQRSAEQGYAAAQNDLGACYTHGQGVDRNYSIAAYWFRKSAEQEFRYAQYNLGFFYAKGLGVEKHLNIAAAWYREAASGGHAKAQLEYLRLLDGGIVATARHLLQAIAPDSLNADFKKRQQERQINVRRRQSEESVEPRVNVRPCPACGVKIASHAFNSHLREYHRPEPRAMGARPDKVPKKKNSGPPSFPPPVVSTSKINAEIPTSLCPRCSGDGGVRGGCHKCDGTGWVIPKVEHDLLYRLDYSKSEDTKVSNADYLGNNAGAHYREMDGRIGTLPMHDDYSEES